jgi:hypothetical protein
VSIAYALIFVRISIALLFIVSAAGKIVALREFEAAIEDFRLLPRQWARAAALTFVGGEVAVALLVGLGGPLLPLGLLLAIVLLAVFSFAIVSVLYRRIDAHCNCFGANDHRVSRYDVARNLILILCCAAGLWLLGSAQAGVTLAGVVLIALTGIAFVLFVVNLRDVSETVRRPL